MYRHESGLTQSARVGSDMDVVLASDPGWSLASQPEPEAEAAVVDGDPDDKQGGLLDLGRRELNRLAAEAGVERPEKLANKQAVIDAIQAASVEE